MKRKSKGEKIELLYMKTEEKNRKTKSNNIKSKKNRGAASSRPNKNNNTINLDNEIIIGLTPQKVESKKNSSKTKGKTKYGGADVSVRPQKNNTTNSKKQSKSAKKGSSSGKNKKQSKNRKIGLKIFKWTSILVLIVTAIVFFMMSSVFNIKEIVVSNNNKISSEEIIRLSGLITETNMFKTSNKSVRNSIKANPYVENVKIKKDITGTVKFEIEERVPTYMLKFANAYVYINNQGYMLEITETPLELPTITGFETPAESIKEGNRLINEDLKKLEDVIKIIDSSKNNSLANIITDINIADATNYILTIASESKTVQFGDISNVNVKLLKVEALIELEKGIPGEIYFQDSDKTVFSEEVKR